MSKYSNLPGVNIELLDGNLRVDEPIDERAVLLVGTALTGSTNVRVIPASRGLTDCIPFGKACQ